MAWFGLGTKLPARTPSRPRTAPGERIYAVGDIHGRIDLLGDLFARIEAHADALPPVATTHVIVLGDLIDRGPKSAEVLRALIEAQRQSPELLILAGNHEDVMVRALAGDRQAWRVWRRTGGSMTMRSYGIEPPPRGEEPGALLDRIRAAVGRETLEWLTALPLSARSGDYFFCHAGVRPGTPLRRQTRTDLLWIREDFLDDPRDHGAIIVHGHTPTPEVEWRSNRIGVDTGAYETGVLSAVYLEADARELIATGPGAEAPAGDELARAVTASP